MTLPLVALTFDDGPSSFRTRTLQILRDKGVRATFFDVGMRASANPQLVEFAAREGHQVLNHTAHHPDLTGLGAAQIRAEVLAAETSLSAVTPFKAVRPPFMAVDDAVRTALAEIGYDTVIGASVFARDFDAATTPEQVRDAILADLAPGAIIVLHDGNIDTPAGRSVVTALPAIIDGVRERGYAFGTFDARGALVPAEPLPPSAEPIPEILHPVPYLPLIEDYRGDPPQEPPPPYVIMQP